MTGRDLAVLGFEVVGVLLLLSAIIWIAQMIRSWLRLDRSEGVEQVSWLQAVIAVGVCVAFAEAIHSNVEASTRKAARRWC